MSEAVALRGENVKPTMESAPSRPTSTYPEDTKDPFDTPFDENKEREDREGKEEGEEEWWDEEKHDELTDVEEDLQENKKLEEDEELKDYGKFEDDESLEEENLADEEGLGNPENTPIILSDQKTPPWSIQQNNYYIGGSTTVIQNTVNNRYSVTKPTREKSRGRQKKQNVEAGIKVITDFSPDAGSSQAPQPAQGMATGPGNVPPQAGNFVNLDTLQALDKEVPVQPTGWNFWSKKSRDQKTGATKSLDKDIDTTETPSFSTQSGSKLKRSLVPTPLKLEQDLSPNDRPIVIGLTVSSARLAEHTQSPQTAIVEASRTAQTYQDRRREYNNPEPQNPSIMVTRASNEPTLSPAEENRRAPERRPASSIYSQTTAPSPNPNTHDRIIPSIPAVPAYMMRAHTAQQGNNRSATSRESTNTVFDEDVAFPQRSPTRRVSTFTVFDEDESRTRGPAGMTQATNPIHIRNDSVNTPATSRRSGWWNYVTTPFMTRTNTMAAKQSAMKEGQPTTPNLEAAAIKARDLNRSDQIWEKEYTPTTSTTISSESWWDRNRNEGEPQYPGRPAARVAEPEMGEYVRTHRAQDSSATLPFVMSGAIDAEQESRQPPLPSNNPFQNRNRESMSSFATRRTERDLARQASAATALSNNDRDIPLIFDIESPVQNQGNSFMPPRPTVFTSSNSTSRVQINQYENYPPPPPPPPPPPSGPVNITNITYNITNGSQERSIPGDRVLNGAQFLAWEGTQNDSRSTSRERGQNDLQFTSREQMPNSSQITQRELLQNNSQFTAPDRIENDSRFVSREQAQNDSRSMSQGQPRSDYRGSNGERVPNSAQLAGLERLQHDTRSLSRDGVQNDSRSLSEDRLRSDYRGSDGERVQNSFQPSGLEQLPHGTRSLSRDGVQNDSRSVSQDRFRSDYRGSDGERVQNTSQFAGLEQLPHDTRSLSRDGAQYDSQSTPSIIAPPYSPPRTRLARFGQQEVAHTTSTDANNQRSSSPGPISPGMQQIMTSTGGIPLHDVPLESPRRRPINLNSGYPGSSPPQSGGAYITVNDLETPGELARKAEVKRKRQEKKEKFLHKIGGFWKGKGFLAKRGCLGRKKEEGQQKKEKKEKKEKKKKRNIWLIIAFLLVIALIIALLLGLRKRKSNSQVEFTQWLNLTGFPSIFLGISTVAVPVNTLTDTSCVDPATFWSCDLPKELQPTIAPNGANQPNFRLQIQWDNSSAANATFANVTGDKNLPVKRNAESYMSASQFFKRLFLGSRQTTLSFDPIPSAPSFAEEFFLGNTTDGIVSSEKAGEPTPFFITFLSPTADVSAELNILRKRETSSSNSTSNSNSSSDDSFPDIIAGIPAPSINTADGTASPANLLPSPLPIQQPLRLYDRALPTEHYGFYSYFDRSIFLSSVNLTTGSGEVPSDENGGATEDEAKFRCTWAQTRFRVQIWTNMGAAAQLNNITDFDNGDNTQISNAKQPSPEVTANDFSSPGSFPYPITLTLDRHGGNAQLKEIYCYQVGAGETGGVTYLDVHPTLQLENRGSGGTLISPAPSLFKPNPSAAKAFGGVDGGTGGCKCGWQNFVGAT